MKFTNFNSSKFRLQLLIFTIFIYKFCSPGADGAKSPIKFRIWSRYSIWPQFKLDLDEILNAEDLDEVLDCLASVGVGQRRAKKRPRPDATSTAYTAASPARGGSGSSSRNAIDVEMEDAKNREIEDLFMTETPDRSELESDHSRKKPSRRGTKTASSSSEKARDSAPAEKPQPRAAVIVSMKNDWNQQNRSSKHPGKKLDKNWALKWHRNCPIFKTQAAPTAEEIYLAKSGDKVKIETPSAHGSRPNFIKKLQDKGTKPPLLSLAAPVVCKKILNHDINKLKFTILPQKCNTTNSNFVLVLGGCDFAFDECVVVEYTDVQYRQPHPRHRPLIGLQFF